MNFTITYKCECCGKRISYEMGEVELNHIDMTTVVCDILERPYCGTCDREEVEGHTDPCGHEEWIYEEGYRYCLICGHNLTLNCTWEEVYEMERKWDERQEALADLYAGDEEEEIVDGVFIGYSALPDSKDIVL